MRQVWLALLLAGFAGAASAYENFGPYVGLGAGQAQANVDFDTGAGVIPFDADDTAWRVFAGYRYSRWFAFELTYSDLGEFTDDLAADRLTIGHRGMTPWLVGSWPIGRFELLARAGYFINTTEFEIVTATGRLTGSESNDSVAFGAGGGVMLGDHINMRLEYELMDLDTVDDSSAVWLTAAWRKQ